MEKDLIKYGYKVVYESEPNCYGPVVVAHASRFLVYKIGVPVCRKNHFGPYAIFNNYESAKKN